MRLPPQTSGTGTVRCGSLQLIGARLGRYVFIRQADVAAQV